MEFTTIDFIVIGLILFLGLKGFITGFTHELFNFIGIIGGFALATRVADKVGNFINDNIYPLTGEPTIKLVGVAITLLGVWILFSIISSMFRSQDNNDISLLSRILGYVVSVAKYSAILGLIFVAINRSDFLSEKLLKNSQNSKTLPILLNIGEKLLNSDINISKESNSTIKDINLSAINLDG